MGKSDALYVKSVSAFGNKNPVELKVRKVVSWVDLSGSREVEFCRTSTGSVLRWGVTCEVTGEHCVVIRGGQKLTMGHYRRFCVLMAALGAKFLPHLKSSITARGVTIEDVATLLTELQEQGYVEVTEQDLQRQLLLTRKVDFTRQGEVWTMSTVTLVIVFLPSCDVLVLALVY